MEIEIQNLARFGKLNVEGFYHSSGDIFGLGLLSTTKLFQLDSGIFHAILEDFEESCGVFFPKASCLAFALVIA